MIYIKKQGAARSWRAIISKNNLFIAGRAF
jgi:hypothetical protein